MDGGRMENRIGRKKLLIVVPSLGIGGQERVAVNMVNCLKADYDVKLVVFQTKEQEYAAPCEVVNLRVPTAKGKLGKIFGQLRRAVRLKRIIRAEKADIIFSLGATANLTNALAKSRRNGKHIVAIHGFAEVRKSRLNSYIFKKADCVVSISQEMQYRLLQLYPGIRNAAVVENGYDVKAAPAEKAPVDPQKVRFVAMGRLEAVKGFDRLIRAFAKISEAIPGAHLSLIGDGPQKERLNCLAVDLGVGDRVDFLGYLSEPLAKLSENDVYLLTSRNEGFPNCLIEALSCGLAVVAVDCLSGPKEILSEVYRSEPVSGICFAKYGVLVENHSDEDKLIETFAEAVLQLLRSEDRLAAYQSTGNARANDFSLAVFREKLIHLFEK